MVLLIYIQDFKEVINSVRLASMDTMLLLSDLTTGFDKAVLITKLHKLRLL